MSEAIQQQFLSSSLPPAENAPPETRLRLILDAVEDCYLEIDHSFRISDANSTAARWIGSSIGDLLGQHFFDVFNKNADDRAVILAIIASQRMHRVEMASTIHPERWVEADFHPSSTKTMILFRDISDRKAAMAAAAVSEKAKNLMLSALDATSNEIAILDQAGRVLVGNEAWRRFMCDVGGYYPDDGIGEEYLELRWLHPVKSQLLGYRAGIKAILTGELREFKMSFRTKVRRDYRNYRLRVSRMVSDGWQRIVVAREDVTELETALHDVDNMAVRMVNLQESERQRYAAELHDSTVQHLTAASLNLMVLRGRSDSSDEDGLLGTIENSVAEAQREIRSVSYLLYPRALDEDGLTSTLSRFSSGFASRTKIASFVRTFGPLDSLPLPLQRAALRIVQEAMANVHRHAGAMAVRIRVAVGEGRLSISVADNGKGMSVDAEGNVLHPGIGIAGMKARAHHFGGSLRIRSSIGRGTIILLRIPVQIRPSVISDKQQSRDVRRHRRPSVAGLANLGVFPIILRVFANLA